MSKEADNSFGVAGAILGILSIIFIASNGVILAIVGLIFSNIQRKRMANKWSKAGMILNIIGLVFGLLLIFVLLYVIKHNPQFAQQLQQLNQITAQQ